MGEATAQSMSGPFANEDEAGDYQVAEIWCRQAVRSREARPPSTTCLAAPAARLRGQGVGGAARGWWRPNGDWSSRRNPLNADLKSAAASSAMATEGARAAHKQSCGLMTKADPRAKTLSAQGGLEAVSKAGPSRGSPHVGRGGGLADPEREHAPGQTGRPLLGSSRRGQSSLVNCAAGLTLMVPGPYEEERRGGRPYRNTHRKLVLCRTGRMMLDTPGMRGAGGTGGRGGWGSAVATFGRHRGALVMGLPDSASAHKRGGSPVER